MSKNDTRIKETLKIMDTKRAALGDKPRAVLKSNGIIKYADGDNHVNINTIQTLTRCVDVTAVILKELAFVKEASELLEVPHEKCAYDDVLEDLKLIASIIKWDIEKKKLTAIERKLKDLRSEDAKTEDALSDILSELE